MIQIEKITGMDYLIEKLNILKIVHLQSQSGLVYGV
jgi:hypothetical protein